MFGRLGGQGLARLLSQQRVASLAILFIGAIGTLIYARSVHPVYPIPLWLFWKLATIWGWSLLFNLACASFGQWLNTRVLGLRDQPALEAAVMAMASGVVSFTLAMYAGGALGWYSRWFAIALPLGMLAIGARAGLALARELWQELSVPRAPSWIAMFAGGAGLLCVGVVLLGAFTPHSLNYDSTWSHLVVAQEYARAGRIIPFPADYNKNVPQLASLIYAWGYLLPGFSPYPALRWMFALNSEFCMFLWTLASVAAFVRMLVPDPELRRAWAVFFLFPIIFVYDNNLGGSADHVCGFFSVPIAIAAIRLCEEMRRRRGALLAITSAGALLTKYQAVFIIVPTAILIGGAWLRQALLQRRRQGHIDRELLALPLWIAGLGLGLFSPHLLRQLVFHHNPVYPLAQDFFTSSTPTIPNAAFLFSNALADPAYQPEGSLLDKLLHAAHLALTFSFRPHYSFTNDVPAFGSLFTLLLPVIAFVHGRSRLLMAAGLGVGAVFTWGLVYHIDRNLQVFMPVLVGVTGAIIVKAYRVGALARAGIALLVAFQIVWGGDALFYSQWDRIQSAMDLVRSGYESQARRRFRDFRRPYLDLNKKLPRDARVLLHTSHLSLGIEREVLLDWAGFQALFDYRPLKTPRELYDYLRGHGITHLAYEPRGRPASTRQEDVLWKALAEGYGDLLGDYGDLRLIRMPSTAPPAVPAFRVAAFGMGVYKDGVYPVEAMNTYQHLPRRLIAFAPPAIPLPRSLPERLALLAGADAVVVSTERPVDGKLDRAIRRDFTSVYRNDDELELFLRNSHFAPDRANRSSR